MVTEYMYKGFRIYLNPNRKAGAKRGDASYYWKVAGLGIYKTVAEAKKAINKEAGRKRSPRRR